MTFISHLPKSHSISFLHRTTARLRTKTTIMRTSNATRMSQNFNSNDKIEGHAVLGDEVIEEDETLMRGRSDQSRVGQECVSRCSYRGSRSHSQKTTP